jgi:hypothetical protein
MAAYEIKFELVSKGMKVCPVPKGKLIITRVPGHGLMGVYRPETKTSGGQVILPAGKVRSMAEAEAQTYQAWRDMMGLDDLRSFV